MVMVLKPSDNVDDYEELQDLMEQSSVGAAAWTKRRRGGDKSGKGSSLSLSPNSFSFLEYLLIIITQKYSKILSCSCFIISSWGNRLKAFLFTKTLPTPFWWLILFNLGFPRSTFFHTFVGISISHFSFFVSGCHLRVGYRSLHMERDGTGQLENVKRQLQF